jgi:hypothetical protein
MVIEKEVSVEIILKDGTSEAMFYELLKKCWPLYDAKETYIVEYPYSYQRYDSCISKELKSLSFNQLFKFCIWSASRLCQDDKYVKDINQDEVALLHSIIDEAWSWTEKQKYPDVEYVKKLRDQIFKIGPEDPVAAIETDPMETNMIGSVELVLEFYLTKSLKWVNSAAHSLINVIDYEAQDEGNCLPLGTMLLFPPMKIEFERQLKMIEHLRNEKVDGVSLQELTSM